MNLITDSVRAHVRALPADQLPAYVYDLDHLHRHVARIRSSLPDAVELYYAVKANPEPAVLGVLAAEVDGFDVSSGGELARLARASPVHVWRSAVLARRRTS